MEHRLESHHKAPDALSRLQLVTEGDGEVLVEDKFSSFDV